MLYRSTELSGLDGVDATAFARLRIRTVYDLRTDAERAARPDRLPTGTCYVVVDVLKGTSEATPMQLIALLADPAAAGEVLGNGRAVVLFQRKYREFVSLESARLGYGRLFSDLAEARNRPALFHCFTGKDRTGWAAAALLMLLDVPDELVMKDFLLSNTRLLPGFRPTLDRFEAQGGDPQLLRPLIGVRPEYLAAAVDEMRRSFGTVGRYFSEGLGVDAATQRAVRAALVEDATS